MESIPQIALAATAVFVLLSIGMATAVGVRRAQTGISLLHGDDEKLLRLIRAHANFVEYVPLALLAIAAAEIAGVVTWLVALCAGVLLLARLIHYFSLRADAASNGRVVGAAMTSATMLVLSVAILWQIGGAG